MMHTAELLKLFREARPGLRSLQSGDGGGERARRPSHALADQDT
jgi:hypothetical protein